MKYSARPVHKNIPEVAEIKCAANRLGDIYDFFKAGTDKRCNITLSEDHIPDHFLEQVEFIRKCTTNYTISCTNFNVMRELLHRGYKAYFDYPITDWELFNTLKDLGVSDICIDGPLGFQMDKIAKGKDTMIIRVSPASSSNASLSNGDNINSFFIRPEDMHLYADIVDIVDFRAVNSDMEKVLLDIYIRGSFDHNLKLLVKNLNIDIENPFIDAKFAESRLNCGQRCKIPGYSCHLCQTQFRLTNLVLNYVKTHN